MGRGRGSPYLLSSDVCHWNQLAPWPRHPRHGNARPTLAFTANVPALVATTLGAFGSIVLPATTPRRTDAAVGLPGSPPVVGRRHSIAVVASSGAALLSGAELAHAGQTTSLKPRRRRLREVIAESGLDNWKLGDYEAMRDDAPRTSKFEAAIERRIGSGRAKVVVDIGTGPFALLALMAARAGAERVYAIEINSAAAALAREMVAKAGYSERVTVIEGDSMQVELPERVDLVVSELIGSIATQEGVAPIIRDARRRFLKADIGSDGMIPARCQTLVAPILYRGRSLLSKITNPRGIGEGVKSRGRPVQGTSLPLRVKASDESTLEFLSPPKLLEDFDYNLLESLDQQREVAGASEDRALIFELPTQTDALKARKLQFSGFAMWTRVVVDDVDVVEVRGQPDSHWAFVVALLSRDPVRLMPGEVINLQSRADYSADPVRYIFDAEVPAV